MIDIFRRMYLAHIKLHVSSVPMSFYYADRSAVYHNEHWGKKQTIGPWPAFPRSLSPNVPTWRHRNDKQWGGGTISFSRNNAGL